MIVIMIAQVNKSLIEYFQAVSPVDGIGTFQLMTRFLPMKYVLIYLCYCSCNYSVPGDTTR